MTVCAIDNLCGILVNRHDISHLCDYRLWVSLVDSKYYDRHVKGIIGASRWTELLIGNMARLAHDHTHTETWGLLGSHRYHQLGE